MFYDDCANYFINDFRNVHSSRPFPGIEGFGKGEFLALNLLDASDCRLSAGDLSARMMISSARVAAMLGRLEEKGYVTRDIDPVDRRRIMITLTDKGKESFKKHREMMKKMLVGIFEKMGEKDATELVRLVARFSQLMGDEMKEGKVESFSVSAVK